MGAEFYGLVPGRNELEEIPNALWLNLELYEDNILPKSIFAFEDYGSHAMACLLLTELKNEECPVILWDEGENRQNQLNNPNIISKDFGEYFYQRIIELIESDLP